MLVPRPAISLRAASFGGSFLCPLGERAPVGLHLASTTQKPAASDRNNVYTTVPCGVVLHRGYAGRASGVDPGKVRPTDSLVRISWEMDGVSAGNCTKARAARSKEKELGHGRKGKVYYRGCPARDELALEILRDLLVRH
ncbi:hypothetical protein KM043_002914 [Ampulex compressa]|nr:hypothetical protein KM043_002914 [Ampulex compressa]